ncbi:hypothetical protein ACJ41P_22755 [Azospirillum argentinense]|uniref:Uncharacterized protein n=1 Tax=Azospirillum argentinense TaxID=2970906 RepID=A0ABW8VCL0_9PROT
MSVVNIAVMPDRILILTDTLTYRGETPVSLRVRKGAISETGGFVTTARGSRWICDLFMHVNDGATDLDGALALWRGELPKIDPFLHGKDGSELFMVGFSHMLGGLAAVSLKSEFPEGKPVVTERDFGPGIHLAPEFPGRVEAMLPKVADEHVMQRIALAQWKVQRKTGMKLCIGGCMWLFEVTPNGATERIVGTYPDYATHAAAFGDPNAGVVASLFPQEKVA